jgi:hypothetical protein
MFLTLRLFCFDLQAIFQHKKDPVMGVLAPGEGKARTIVRVLMQVLITLTVLVAGTAVILNPNQHVGMEKAVWGAFGTLVGYWLR